MTDDSLPADEPAALHLETLVADCLHLVESDGLHAIESICEAHPEIADEIRERVKSAVDLGLVSIPFPAAIGRYEILRPLGKGGMGEVLLGKENEPVKRLVAIKRIREALADEQLRLRFAIEAQALALLDHPSIAKVFEVAEDEARRPYFVMEYVDGKPVTDFADEQRMTIDERLGLLASIADAVQHAHQKGVVHRDIKPTNLLAYRSGEETLVKVIDFGLAKPVEGSLTDETFATRYGQLIGTPEYMSPEQASEGDKAIDTRTDVYSLGVVLYELCVGALPFDSRRLRESGPLEMLRILREEIPASPTTRLANLAAAERIAEQRSTSVPGLLSSLRGELEWIFAKATAKAKDQRYATATEFAADLRRHLEGQPVVAAPPSRLYPLRKFVARNKATVSISAVAALGLVAALVVISSLFSESQRNLRGFLRLDQARSGELLLAGLDDLWPLDEAGLERSTQWRRDVAHWDAETRDVYGEIDSLEAARPEQGSFEARIRDSRLNAARRLIDVREQLVSSNGWVPVIEKRIDFATSLLDAAALESDPSWRDVNERLRARHGFEMIPQRDLVPLGPDPRSELEEFAVLEPAVTPPTRVDGDLVFPENSRAVVLVLLPAGDTVVGAQPFTSRWPRFDPEAYRRDCLYGGWLRSEKSDDEFLKLADEGPFPLLQCELDPFLISKFEVTEHQFRRVIAGPEQNQELPDPRPAHELTQTDASDYSRRVACQLPTRAQFGYAGYGGRNRPWWWGDEPTEIGAYANIADRTIFLASSQERVTRYTLYDEEDGYQGRAPVGSFQPNPFGLHDMIGNVWEFTRQPYLEYWNTASIDAEGVATPVEGWTVNPSRGIAIGGSYRSDRLSAKPHSEISISMNEPKDSYGFRAVRNGITR